MLICTWVKDNASCSYHSHISDSCNQPIIEVLCTGLFPSGIRSSLSICWQVYATGSSFERLGKQIAFELCCWIVVKRGKCVYILFSIFLFFFSFFL